MRFSIVIVNYNYERFVAEAIESALAVRWPNKEVIVVDDGSTDNSRAIIAQFGDKITPIFKDNGGQNSAANIGFRQSSGDMVCFLDSDDVLLPSVAEQIASIWQPDAAKVQWAMLHINSDGERLGTQWPTYTEKHTSGWARLTFETTSFYDAPPTSGNAWSRKFLDQVFPLPTRQGKGRWGNFFDDYLHMLAPYFGEIYSIVEPQSLYRIHTSNNSPIGKGFSIDWMAAVCEEEMQRAQAANDLLIRLGKIGPGQEFDFDRYYEHVLNRLVVKRLAPDEYPADDGRAELWLKYCLAVTRADLNRKRKAMFLVWGMVVCWSPRTFADRLVHMRFEKDKRPF